MDSGWQFWIDVGGTFTDCIGIDPYGKQYFAKVLSSGQVQGRMQLKNGQWNSCELAGYCDQFWAEQTLSPIDFSRQFGPTLTINQSAKDGTIGWGKRIPATDSFSFSLDTKTPAPIFAIRKILALPFDQPLPRLEIRLGTTRGTNALLTRSGARVCFVTTKGYQDLLRIGFQNRPDLFAIDVEKPEPLFENTIEVDERIHFDGNIGTPLSAINVRNQLLQIKSQGIDSLAICLMHGYRYPQHEKKIEQIAREIGFSEISSSHQVAPEIRIIPRAFTTVLDAYLNPVLRSYVSEIQSHLHFESHLQLFTSAGSLVEPNQFTGKDSILSGPAGGVMGFSKTAQSAGIQKSIGFDMGGTSTDVSRFDGEYHYQYESEKSGVFIVSPTLSIETVAAGGGSICGFDGQRLTVGPQSAGAHPGPACYGKGGPLCLSDINLFLERIHADSFPFPIDRSIVIEKLNQIQDAMIAANLKPKGIEWIANGFLKIAVAKTAEAIRLVSIQKGYDCQDYTLVSFGGAAGQICCQVAEELEIQKILVHPQASILSAAGIGLANRTEHDSLGLYGNLDDYPNLDLQFQKIESKILSSVNQSKIKRKIDLRYQGTESYLTIGYDDCNSLLAQFSDEHQKRFGYIQNKPLEIGSIRIEVMQTNNHQQLPSKPNPTKSESILLTPPQFRIVDRSTLSEGSQVHGPALICDPFSTTVVDDQWQAECLDDFQVLLTKTEVKPSNTIESAVDEVQLELFNNRLFSIAEQMGEVLRATAVSVNVKERLDFSCAIFDAVGNLIANAPHIPIHLGAMSDCVKCIIADNESIVPGTVFVTNDPYRGGSHLPDVTVVTPCFDSQNDLVFWVASRAHHAEIGGKVPGSMPPDSTCLADEGVLIQNFLLLSQNGNRFNELEQLLRSGPYPSRQPQTNISDVKAQVAANNCGIHLLKELAGNTTKHVLPQLIDKLFAISAAETQKVIHQLTKKEYRFEDYLDCGAKIQLRIAVKTTSLLFDFTGSSGVLPNNLNANPSIVNSAIIYCLRLMIGKDIPLNQGILQPIEVSIPLGFLNPKPATNPCLSPAIVGGNVETSQRIVDVIFGAFEIAAASQGTTNNVIFGDQNFGYYETVCGGSGASKQKKGADAIQVHITNTRITDPEILESRYPVVLEEFSIRAGSGGLGKH
ncbi:MAG: hydantoinase B/oxoprolinase family protein, partial [Planctomycetota bacterium]|nr:hydantoinase B/oxoprolinase family protein [Planctomycetota bacterium]